MHYVWTLDYISIFISPIFSILFSYCDPYQTLIICILDVLPFSILCAMCCGIWMWHDLNLQRYMADIGKAWPVLIVCGGILPLFLSVIWLMMIRHFVAAMPWITVVLFNVLIISVTMFYYLKGQQLFLAVSVLFLLIKYRRSYKMSLYIYIEIVLVLFLD